MNELTRLAQHVAAERERAPRADRLRHAIAEQVSRVGAVTLTRDAIEEMFSRPDVTENFFLAASGCRPVGTIMEQLESWCASNDFEMYRNYMRLVPEVTIFSRAAIERGATEAGRP